MLLAATALPAFPAPAPPEADMTGDECAAILNAFLRALSSITHYEVTGEHLLAAINSLNETDGVVFDIARVDHIGLVIERLVEMHVEVG